MGNNVNNSIRYRIPDKSTTPISMCICIYDMIVQNFTYRNDNYFNIFTLFQLYL